MLPVGIETDTVPEKVGVCKFLMVLVIPVSRGSFNYGNSSINIHIGIQDRDVISLVTRKELG